jgi:probable DNA metabolism protein
MKTEASLEAFFEAFDGAFRDPPSLDGLARDYRAKRGGGHFARGLLPDPASLKGAARRLYDSLPGAYDDLVHAWMSELPVEPAMIRFGLDALKSGKAALDRGSPHTLAVLEAAYKAAHEVDRLMGLLRFNPEEGRYVARCAPDHDALPGLALHFTLRFGATPWAVVDEKRRIVMAGEGGEPRIMETDEFYAPERGGEDPYAGLWRLYHRSISNETRKNLSLQRQFMPVRYRKYLTECEGYADGEPADPDESGQGSLDL